MKVQVSKLWAKVMQQCSVLIDKNKVTRHDVNRFARPFINRDVYNLVELADEIGDVTPIYTALKESKDFFAEVDTEGAVSNSISEAMKAIEPYKVATLEERVQAIEAKLGLNKTVAKPEPEPTATEPKKRKPRTKKVNV